MNHGAREKSAGRERRFAPRLRGSLFFTRLELPRDARSRDTAFVRLSREANARDDARRVVSRRLATRDPFGAAFVVKLTCFVCARSLPCAPRRVPGARDARDRRRLDAGEKASFPDRRRPRRRLASLPDDPKRLREPETRRELVARSEEFPPPTGDRRASMVVFRAFRLRRPLRLSLPCSTNSFQIGFCLRGVQA